MGEEVDLRDYWRVLKKRKWVILILFLSASISSAIASFFMTPVYEANTSVLVRSPESGLDMPFLETLAGMGKNPVQNFVEILKSRSLAERAASKMGYKFKIPSPEFDAFRGRISVQPVQGTETIRITVSGTDPEETQRAANTLVATFTVVNQATNREEARNAREFIEGQLQVVEGDLRQAEDALQRFKESEKIIAPSEETKATIEKITDLEKMRAEARVGIQESQSRIGELRGQLRRQDETLISSTTISSNPLVQQYKSRLSELEVQLSAALERYTDKHPTVTGLRVEITETRKKLNSEVERIVSNETRTLNPIHQALLQQLIGLEVEAISLSSREQAVGHMIEQYEASFASLPRKELMLARLTRNAQVTEQIYLLLRTKYEEVRISEAMKSADVQVIDPAVLPVNPVRPKKKLNVAIAGFLGLFIGVGLAFFLEYLDTTIKTEEQVQEILGLPVLGRIPILSAPSGGGGSAGRHQTDTAVGRRK